MKSKTINIIGAGLAGSEAAYFLANKGYKVKLYEKRPLVSSEAHKTDKFAELVCSNSLKSKALDNACGLLKEEIHLLGSIMMEAAAESEVKGGDSLNVDREIFSDYITKKINEHENIEVIYQDVEEPLEGINLICTGPLTSAKLLSKISFDTNEKVYGFYDASSPIVEKDSIDFSKCYFKSRYDKGDPNILNCPMTKSEYDLFYNELINAKRAPLHDFDTNYFEGCLPVEIIASRGIDTLRFGPLKPVGLENNEHQPYAVVQLRQDDLIGDFYNLVGFQTNLTYSEQRRVFALIPGLEKANYIRFGLMHRNSYLYTPKVLNADLSLKCNADIYVGGQLSGVEGYVESAASGLMAAIYLYLKLEGKEFRALSFNTVLGALLRYITHTGANNFAPMNANFGIIYRANKDPKELVIKRSLDAVKDFINYINE